MLHCEILQGIKCCLDSYVLYVQIHVHVSLVGLVMEWNKVYLGQKERERERERERAGKIKICYIHVFHVVHIQYHMVSHQLFL